MFPGTGKAIFLASGAGPPLLSAAASRLSTVRFISFLSARFRPTGVDGRRNQSHGSRIESGLTSSLGTPEMAGPAEV
jgi:hypothetical protein